MRIKNTILKTNEERQIMKRVIGPMLLLLISMVVFACGQQGTASPELKQEGQGVLSKPKVFLESTIELDEAAETITLPLFMGTHNEDDVFYIITESSDRDDAEARGVNWSPKLANARGTEAVQNVTAPDDVVDFNGTVDFTPDREVVPGPTAFPPDVALPGSIGDINYSPLIEIEGNGIVLNAPQLVHGNNKAALHDSVVNIDFDKMEVTLELVSGFYHGKKILYISTDVSDSGVAALEASTFAPNMNAAPGLASNDLETSARSAIVPIINGQTGIDHPERQGLQSALMGEGSPMNVTEIHPRNKGESSFYSPLWDVHLAVWTDAAISAGERRRLDHHEDIARAVEDGLIVSGGTGPENLELGGLRAAGFIVNCPIMVMN